MPKASRSLKTVEDLEAAFYDAIGRADIDALMHLWAEDEEIVCVHPGAIRMIGHAAIRSSWEAIFERGGVMIRPTRIHAMQNLMTVVHNVIEEIGHPVQDRDDIHIIATNIYLKTPHGWRIVAHHASVAPGKPPVETAMPTTIH